MPKRRLSPEELQASKERAQVKRNFRRLWTRSDLSLEELSEEAAMTQDQALEFAKSLGLGDRGEPECYLPTPEEIRLSAAAIRFSWTQEELEARRVDGRFR